MPPLFVRIACCMLLMACMTMASAVNKQKAFILGSVCMDMLMVDVTGIDCSEGDDVIVFGESPTVIEIAEKTQTIPYEILTSISQRVKRVFYRD